MVGPALPLLIAFFFPFKMSKLAVTLPSNIVCPSHRPNFAFWHRKYPSPPRPCKYRSISANTDPAAALVTVAANIKGTGIPILEELLKKNISDATATAVVLLTRSAIGGMAALAALGFVYRHLYGRERQNSGIFRPFVAISVSVGKPALVLLPYYIVARLLTITSALFEVYACKQKLPEILMSNKESYTLAIRWVKRCTQFAQDSSELVVISFVAWSVCRLKSRVLEAIRLKMLRESGGDSGTTTLSRLLGGADTIVTWMVWILASVVALGAYGIDLKPLVASLGASSIVVGIAAQSVFSNLIAGISLFTSSSFIIGDRITVLTSGAGVVVCSGTVSAFTTTRTILRDEDGSTVYINNSDMAKMIIKNESQIIADLATRSLSVPSPST